MTKTLATSIVLSLLGVGCKETRPVEVAEEKPSQELKDFWTICLWEGRGVIRENAVNARENARGAAQIRPCFLQDANEWLKSHGMKEYIHMDMHDSGKAFIVCQAYWRRYHLTTTEQRCRAHASGPDGPYQDNSLDYWHGCQSYL